MDDNARQDELDRIATKILLGAGFKEAVMEPTFTPDDPDVHPDHQDR
jgi:hypothetical protein